MNRRTVEFFSNYPAFFELNYGTGKLYRVILPTFLVTIAVTQALIYSLQNISNINNFIFSFATFICTIIVSTSSGAFLYHNKKIRQLMRQIDQHMYIYSDESKITPSYAWIEQDQNIVRVFLYICGYHTSLAIGMVLSPYIQLFFNGKIEVLVYPGWIPWPIDQPVPFLSAYIIHSTILLVGWVSFTLCCIFPLFIMLEFRRQRKRLCAALISIEKRAKEKVRLTMKKNEGCTYESHTENNCLRQLNYRRMLKQNIIECLRHHQMLLTNFRLFQSWWGIVFSVQLGVSIVNVTLTVFAFMEHLDLIRLANTVGVGSCCVVGLLLNCFIGEEFSMLNVEIKNIIFYETKWYSEETDIKHLLIIFHMLVSRRPFTLYGLYIFEASYATFAYICKKSYSGLNILLASTK